MPIALHQAHTNESSFPAAVESLTNFPINIQLCQSPLGENDIQKTRLSSRRWCFQERLLSTRILHCLPSGIVFECGQGSSCDCPRVGSSHQHLNSDFKALFTDNQMTGS